MTVAYIYDLGVASLAVEAEKSSHLDGFERFLGERRLDRALNPSMSVSIRIVPPRPSPPPGETLYRGPLLEEGECLFTRLDGSYFMAFPGEASLEIDTMAGCAVMTVSPDHLHRATGSLVAIAIEFAFDHHGQQLMHAAGLALPEGRGMILISAPSGTGKTTTALALARHGFGFAADDVLALRLDGTGIQARGLPRALNVHRRTAEMLPWIPVENRWNGNGEQSIPFRHLAETVALEDRELPVRRLVLLQRGPKPGIAPLPAAEALAAVAADNVRGSLAGLTPLQGRRFTMLAELARTTPACRATLADGLGGIEPLAEMLKL